MNSMEITIVRITEVKNITPARIKKIVQAVRAGEQPSPGAGKSCSGGRTKAPTDEKKKLTVELEC